MPLAAGTRLGAYEITAAIGAGGMGEVYRARDLKLNREVAIKVLPDLLAADPDRLARFEREAQMLAALAARVQPTHADGHGLALMLAWSTRKAGRFDQSGRTIPDPQSGVDGGS